jgi:hypothetical protein
VQELIKQKLENYSEKALENIKYISECAKICADRAINCADKDQRNEAIKILKITLDANRDLLNRAGYGEVRKSMSVKKTIKDNTDVAQVTQRIAELEAMIEDKAKVRKKVRSTSTQGEAPQGMQNSEDDTNVPDSSEDAVQGKQSNVEGNHEED